MNTITWLHLSDLHFRAGEQHTWDENIVLEALLEDVRARIREDGFRPDLILVSGDIAFSGKQQEYALASAFFEELLSATQLSRDCIFPVPGNHDVDRKAISRGAQAIAGSLTGRESTNAVLNTAADRQLLFDRFRGYAAWLNEYLGGHLAFDDERYYYVHTLELAGQRLALMGLNSAWVAASDEDRASGLLLGERQTRSALREAAQAGATLTIALLHHPFDWLREFDQNDSAALLLDRCDLVLHGHLHQAAATRLTSPDGEATILACGACYKTRQYPNMYNWVQLTVDADTGAAQARVHLRRYSDARGGFWAPDTLTYRNVPDGVYSFPVRGLPLPPATPPPTPGKRQPPPPPPPVAEPDVDEPLAGIRIDPDDPPYAVLRELLAESFGPPELQRFCQERRELRPVVRQFSPTQGLDDRIDRLLDYCRTRLLWDFLLRELATVRPQQVQRYAAQLKGI